MSTDNLIPQMLETERLWLSIISVPYYKHLLSSCSDERIMNELGIGPDDLPLEKERFHSGCETFNVSFLRMYLTVKHTKKVIGTCSFFSWYKRHHRAEVGYSMFGEAAKRKGYMKEALARMIQYGFEEMNLQRMEAMISPANKPSIRLVTGLGFRQEGLMKAHYLKNGVYEDSAIYALLKHEYQAKTK